MRLANLILLLATAAAAQEAEPEAVPLKGVPPDGGSHHVRCKDATYWISIPKGVDPKAPVRVLLWLHGSNMNGKAYVDSLRSLGYGESELVVGPNGNGKVRDWTYNFDYDPKPVLKTLEDLETRFRLGPVYVGGHSQGAYFTFLLLTKFPERFAGGCAFAGGLLKGCDPKAAASRKGRPGPALAIIHGEADPVVDPELSDWAYEIFLDASWPRLRYYHPKELNHMFLVGPVKPAIDWLYAVTSDDPAALLASAEALLAEERGADALSCLALAEQRKGEAAAIAALRQKVLAAGKERSDAWAARMRGEKPEAWAAEFYEFRERWGSVPTAQAAPKSFEPLRRKQLGEAGKLSRDAWASARKGENAKAKALFGEIVEKCPLAYEYARSAARWIAAH